MHDVARLESCMLKSSRSFLRGIAGVKNIACAQGSSVQQTIGIAAAELLEEIRQTQQLWVDAKLRSETNGSFCCFTHSQRRLPPKPTPSFVALGCPDLL